MRSTKSMKSLSLGRYFRIPVFVHWSFLFILVFISYTSISEGMDLTQVAAFSLYIFLVFFCVVLHEYGHALMARRYGIETQDIIITPIGGLARLRGMPMEPKGELMIAIAGPLVNLAIAAVILLILYGLGVGIILPDTDDLNILTNPIGFLHLVLILNLILFTFNLIPAFPMDGGRILRALLCFKFDRRKATLIVSIIGRIIAVAFVLFATYNKLPSLLFIGIFIFIMAGREYRAVS